jgi:hypothetical protein
MNSDFLHSLHVSVFRMFPIHVFFGGTLRGTQTGIFPEYEIKHGIK